MENKETITLYELCKEQIDFYSSVSNKMHEMASIIQEIKTLVSENKESYCSVIIDIMDLLIKAMQEEKETIKDILKLPK